MIKRTPEMQEMVDNAFKRVWGRSQTEAAEAKICSRCGVTPGEFKDDISKREYEISGLCQGCQDIIFAAPEGEDG